MLATSKGHYFTKGTNDPNFCQLCGLTSPEHKSRPLYFSLSRKEWIELKECYGDTIWKHTEIGPMPNVYWIALDKFGKHIFKTLEGQRQVKNWNEINRE